MTPFQQLRDGVRQFFLGLGDHALSSHAAATAYYLLFSVPPALLGLMALFGFLPLDALVKWVEYDGVRALTSVVGVFAPAEVTQTISLALEQFLQPLFSRLHDLGADGILREVQEALQATLPGPVAQPMVQFMHDVTGRAHPGMLTAGFIGVLWSAGGVTRQATRAMNVIYEVRARPLIRRSLFSIGLTGTLLLVAVLTLILMPLAAGLVEGIGYLLGGGGLTLQIWTIAHRVLLLWIVYATLVLFFRRCVNAHLTARQVRPGVILTILLWGALTVAAGYFGYFGLARFGASFGAIAGIVFALFWCYLMALSLLLGVELNATLLAQRGRWLEVVGDSALDHSRRSSHYRED